MIQSFKSLCLRLSCLAFITIFNKLNAQKRTQVLKNFNDFPGGPVVKNLPANAREVGLIPCLGKFRLLRGNYTHSPQLVSPCSATTEALVP